MERSDERIMELEIGLNISLIKEGKAGSLTVG
jgi:hypothetical protein